MGMSYPGSSHLRGGCFQSGLVGIGMHKDNQGDRDENEEGNESADSKEDNFNRFWQWPDPVSRNTSDTRLNQYAHA